MKEMDAESKRLTKLQARMLKGLNDKLTDIHVNGDLEHRIPGNLNIGFAYVEGESLMMGIKGLSVSVRLGLHLRLARAQLRAACARRGGGHGSYVLAHRALAGSTTRAGGRHRGRRAGAPRQQLRRDEPRSGRWPRKASILSPSNGPLTRGPSEV